MLELPHAAVGAAIVTKIPNPLVSIPLAIASHFVLDMIPHWNPHFFTETQKNGHPSKKSTQFAIAEFGIALAVLTVISITVGPLAFIGGFAAMLPDLLKIPYFFLKKRTGVSKKYVLWERSIQNDTKPIPGLINQGTIVLAAILWLIT